MSALTPWQRIIYAARKGKGIRLSADECHELARDDAIATKAMNDDEEQGRPVKYGPGAWPDFGKEKP